MTKRIAVATPAPDGDAALGGIAPNSPGSVEEIVGDRQDPLIVSDHGAIRFLILNNPSKRNALNEEIRRGLADQCADASRRPTVRVVILTGTGGAFSSGFDLAEITQPGGPAVVRPNPAEAVRGVGKPVIAVVDGPCFTGGLEVALSAGFILASDRARFADTHARFGILPAWGMSALLPRAIGVRRARQLSLTGAPIDAATALTWGLVNEVMSPDRLLSRSIEIAEAIISGDARSQRTQFALLADAESRLIDDAFRAERTAADASPRERDEASSPTKVGP